VNNYQHFTVDDTKRFAAAVRCVAHNGSRLREMLSGPRPASVATSPPAITTRVATDRAEGLRHARKSSVAKATCKSNIELEKL